MKSGNASRLTAQDRTLQERLDAVYGAASFGELQTAYDAWAATYDEDLVHQLHWNAPEKAAACLEKHVPKDALILDVGSGTGLVGCALAQLGYRDLAALDLSAVMLEAAKAKGVYRSLYKRTLGNTLDFPSNHFAAAIGVGVFTEGHARPEAFVELLRVVKPGGHLVFTLRPDVYEKLGFKEAQGDFEAAGHWRLVEKSEFQEGFSALQTRPYQVWVYEVLQT